MKDLSETIREFALSLLPRLAAAESAPENGEAAPAEGGEQQKDEDGEVDMATDASPPPAAPAPYAQVRGARVVDRLDKPTTIEGVTQHVELLLALCVKDTSLLRP